MGDIELIPLVLGGVHEAARRLRSRVDGLTDTEYLWEPVEDMWSVREQGGRWVPQRARSLAEEPDPAKVTTIAWRLWHLTSCLSEYVTEFGGWGLDVPEGEFVGTADAAVALWDRSCAVFTERITALGEDGIRRPLGPRWGPFADESWAALVIHAQDEVAHHGAEIALLRDLYLRLG